MRTAIIVTIILCILITILFFITAVFVSLHTVEICNFVNECIDDVYNNRRRYLRNRRNAVYIHPSPPVREIELTPLPKKVFIVIENPNSPYTLGFECSTE